MNVKNALLCSTNTVALLAMAAVSAHVGDCPRDEFVRLAASTWDEQQKAIDRAYEATANLRATRIPEINKGGF